MNLFQKLLSIITLLLSINSSSQSTTAYLSSHSIDVFADLANSIETIDPQFYKHQLYLVGEIHGIKSGQDIDYTLLTLLNKKINVTTYIAEIDFAKAYFLNQYLKTGDEKLIDIVFQDWVEQDAQWANTDFQNKIKKIRQLNQTLQPNQRIHFEGIDKIQNSILVAKYIRILQKNKFIQKTSLVFGPLLEALDKKEDASIINISTQLLEQLQQNKDFKSNPKPFNALEFALTNCTLLKSSREVTLYENFTSLYKIKEWENKKLYGFFGFAHILQSKGNEGKSEFLATKIEKNPDLQLDGKILSLALLYVNSKMTIPTIALPEAWQEKDKKFTATKHFNHDGELINMEGIEDFKIVTKPNSNTLFNLAGIASPFFHKNIVIHYADTMPKGQRLLLNENGKYTTDYFQYIILVRDSEATQPISK
ncbi:hypothetical protein [Flavobacterium sp. '19STA2R22 D10 B1']|uniref:hypothetical protein n=1 Tax=Flavobacterium aerium TaxID=3037261 RepID=UPI00278C44E6|nr:hypothetical protein [Flavobacterium sp. '19STA2R22 D10 B1']